MWRVEGAMEGGCVTGAQGMRAGTQLQSDPMECWAAPCMSWGSVSLPPVPCSSVDLAQGRCFGPVLLQKWSYNPLPHQAYQ